MKKITVLLLLLTGLSVVRVDAQMQAATPVKWDVSKDIIVNMEADAVWEVFTTADLMKKASNGFVTAIEPDANIKTSRKLIFADGSSRMENIDQQEAHNKLIALTLVDTTLPKGIKSAQIAIFIKAKEEKASIIWRAMVKGDNEAKQALMKQLNAEFDAYALGFDKMTKKSVPATRMN